MRGLVFSKMQQQKNVVELTNLSKLNELMNVVFPLAQTRTTVVLKDLI